MADDLTAIKAAARKAAFARRKEAFSAGQGQAAELLAADSGLRFVGYIEGNRLFRGEADVVVTDGFTGNVALKSMEGAAWMAGQLLRRWFDNLGLIEQAGVALARAKLEALRHELDPQRYNGASFVGLAGVVVKSHGGADVDGFASAIGQGGFTTVAPGATDASVTIPLDRAEWAVTPAKGVMVVTLDNKSGTDEAQLIEVEDDD